MLYVGPGEKMVLLTPDALAFKSDLSNGTYELVGPKIQGNPEGFAEHTLVSHKATGVFSDVPRSFVGIRQWLLGREYDGIVFHHPDGRMAKIKKKDFGFKRFQYTEAR